MAISDFDAEITTLKDREAKIRTLLNECRLTRQRLEEALLEQATILSARTVLCEIKSRDFWYKGWLLRANTGKSLFLEKNGKNIWSAVAEDDRVQLLEKLDLKMTHDIESTSRIMQQCITYAASIPINSIPPESLEDAIVRCANELAAKRAINADDLLYGAPSGDVLVLIEPIPANDHAEATNGYAMVYLGRSRASQSEPHFWTMTLKASKRWTPSSIVDIEATRICHLHFDNPEHLDLIRVVLGV